MASAEEEASPVDEGREEGSLRSIDEKGVVVRVQRIEGEQREEEQDDKEDMSDEKRWERMTARFFCTCDYGYLAPASADGRD